MRLWSRAAGHEERDGETTTFSVDTLAHLPDHGYDTALPDPPTRPQDRAPYGTIGPTLLAALGEARTVGEVACYLHWDGDTARSWVHHFFRRGLVKRIGWKRLPARGFAGIYQRVTE